MSRVVFGTYITHTHRVIITLLKIQCHRCLVLCLITILPWEFSGHGGCSLLACSHHRSAAAPLPGVPGNSPQGITLIQTRVCLWGASAKTAALPVASPWLWAPPPPTCSSFEWQITRSLKLLQKCHLLRTLYYIFRKWSIMNYVVTTGWEIGKILREKRFCNKRAWSRVCGFQNKRRWWARPWDTLERLKLLPVSCDSKAWCYTPGFLASSKFPLPEYTKDCGTVRLPACAGSDSAPCQQRALNLELWQAHGLPRGPGLCVDQPSQWWRLNVPLTARDEYSQI